MQRHGSFFAYTRRGDRFCRLVLLYLKKIERHTKISRISLVFTRKCQYSKAVALKWITQAAKQDNVEALEWMGIVYQVGIGVSENLSIAQKWFLKAVGKGSSGAQNSLGDMYRYGNGVTQNLKEAKKWYENC